MIGKDLQQYIVELDGKAYEWMGGRLEPITDPIHPQREGQKWVVSDFGKSVSRTMTLEAPVKYVEVIARKNMEESGEFDEPVSIITHWKKRADTNTADIFFTALPVRQRQQYFAKAADQPDSVLVFPLYTVLQGVLKRIKHPTPVAVLFQHDRFVDMVVGTKDRVYYANRCVAFDGSEEQVAALWDMVKADIDSVEADHKIEVDRVAFLNWIDSPLKPEGAQGLGRDLMTIGDEAVTLKGQSHRSSFLKALKMQSGLWSASSMYERLLNYCQRLLPALDAVMILALVACAAGYVWFDQRADGLTHKWNALQAEIRALSEETPLSQLPYQDVLSFVRDLERCRTAPAFKTVVNHLSEALSQTMGLEVLKADYGDRQVEIEVFGRAKSPFDEAYKGYQTFISLLKQNGYAVTDSAFNTTLGESTFLAKLTKKI